MNLSSNHSLSNLGHTKFVELLIENGAKVNMHNRFNQFTPLHTAAESGHLETVKSLVEHGANVWSEDYKGQTPRDVAKSKFIHKYENTHTSKTISLDDSDDGLIKLNFR